jgi:FkbM family methyltransferase
MSEAAIENEVCVPHLGWVAHEPADEVATLLRQGHFEAAEQAFFWLLLRDGDSFLDCGAHVGLYSILAGYAAGETGRIVSMEPNPQTARLLRANLSRQGLGRARVLEAAGWSIPGRLDFSPEQAGRAAYSHVAGSPSKHTVTVSATTLTEVAKEFQGRPCTLAKIDTEGAEIEVLRGASEAVSAGGYPLLMVEFNEHNLRALGETTENLFSLLASLGYQMHRFNPETLRLDPAAFGGEIWYENLFAAVDPDGVNQRLASAVPERVRIAQEIIKRGRACNKTKELEELANYKQKAAEMDAVRRWAQQSDALLKQERELSAVNEAWARSTETKLIAKEAVLREVTATLTAKEAVLREVTATLTAKEAVLREATAALPLFKRLQRHWWLKLGKHAHILNPKYFVSPPQANPEMMIPMPATPPPSEPVPGVPPVPPPVPFKTETALDHLVKKGFRPKVIFDVGAAKGYWSELANYFFPDAEFYLLDPLKANEPRLQELCAGHPNIHYFLNAAGEREDEMVINVTPDLDGSSLLSFGRDPQPEDQIVKVVTLDSLLEKGLAQPPQLVKMDVQGYELKALNGGQKLFATAEVFILEISLFEFLPGTPLFHEVVAYMAQRGYVVFDVAGFLRRPFEDDLAQVDLVFVKRGTALVASQRWMASAGEAKQAPPQPSERPPETDLPAEVRPSGPTGSSLLTAEHAWNLIFDIGMHTGEDTAHYLQRGSKVVAVEANPELVAIARQRFARELAEGRLVIVNKAVAPQAGTLTFWINKGHTEWSSADRDLAARGHEELTSLDIEAIPLAALFDEFGVPDYLKVDIEGSDRHCVAALNSARRPAFFSCEYTNPELLEPLVAAGYDRFKLICQFTHRHLAQRLENPDFLNFERDYTAGLWPRVKSQQDLLGCGFPEGSSGPFGEETDGPWLSAEEVRRLYTAIQEHCQCLRSSMPIWCDLHAAANPGMSSDRRLCPLPASPLPEGDPNRIGPSLVAP